LDDAKYWIVDDVGSCMFLQEALYEDALTHAEKRTHGCPYDRRLGQSGLDGFILRERICKNDTIKECVQKWRGVM
jgi:hypothetical protein